MLVSGIIMMMGFFKNLDLHIKAGEKVGLIGYSGAGKSSLVNLLLRYFKATSGEILVDGQDISSVTQDSLRENIAVILKIRCYFIERFLKI